MLRWGQTLQPGRQRTLQEHAEARDATSTSGKPSLKFHCIKVDYNDVTRSFLFNHVSKSRLAAFASRNALRPCTWIQYRYVLSVEGNDVSTAPKWMLFSLSVVFIPLPTVGSCAAEPLMTPWQEYTEPLGIKIALKYGSKLRTLSHTNFIPYEL